MAVVMLREGCKCNNSGVYQHIINNVGKPGTCPTYMAENPPFLSSRFGDWIRKNVCPACHRTIDNIGDIFQGSSQAAADVSPQVVTAYGNLMTTTANAAGNIVSGLGTGVGGFISDPQNIPCAAGMVASAFGMPMGLGGCATQGYNEQNATLVTQEPSLLSNPILLGGLALAAVLLLKK